jgi:predicted solute-binding protein
MSSNSALNFYIKMTFLNDTIKRFVAENIEASVLVSIIEQSELRYKTGCYGFGLEIMGSMIKFWANQCVQPTPLEAQPV